MNKKMIIVLLGILAMFSLVLSGCNGPVAGQAVNRNQVCNGGWEKYCTTLLEGQVQTYTIASSSYNILLKTIVYEDYAGGVHSATFKINNKEVILLEGEEKILSDGKKITLTDLFSQNYAGGVHKATFCISN